MLIPNIVIENNIIVGDSNIPWRNASKERPYILDAIESESNRFAKHALIKRESKLWE
jgi:hypothetical protein